MTTELTFYFDYISHNAYLAWTQLPRFMQQYDLELRPVPVLFAALLDHHGQLGPAEIRPKVRWMTKDVVRKAKLLDVPLKPPASHPFNPLAPLRITCVPMDIKDKLRLIDALFKATWAQGMDVTKPEVVADVANGIGLDGHGLVEEAITSDVKDALRANTQGAIGKEIFGVPTMVIDGELFWGYDDLPHMELFLKGDDPLDRNDFAPWLDVRPSSQRKR